MTNPSSTPPPTLAAASQVRARKPWTTPALARIDSNHAEFGANPVQPEGLAKGS
jgi:hypothetical protein